LADVTNTVPDRRAVGYPYHHHHQARQRATELPRLPLPPQRNSNHQNPASQIVKSSSCHIGDWDPKSTWLSGYDIGGAVVRGDTKVSNSASA
ncbi:hypothetical protein AVEN_78414-2-1, partial [Araneus ventricosus]